MTFTLADLEKVIALGGMPSVGYEAEMAALAANDAERPG